MICRFRHSSAANKKTVFDITVAVYFLLVTFPIFISACHHWNRDDEDVNVTSSENKGNSRAKPSANAVVAARATFAKLNATGEIINNQSLSQKESDWSCVADRRSGLLWELKQTQKGLHSRHNRYSWYNSDPRRNGGNRGSQNLGQCDGSRCDTEAFIERLNTLRFCGSTSWRLPTREELRSLVDYRRRFPGPTIDSAYFPHTVAQFYWSSSPDADDPESAWGIGFSFGYDYSYLKQHAGYVRAVSPWRNDH